MNIVLIDQNDNLIEKVYDLLDRKFEKNIVVFPNKRPSHYLRRYISEKIKKPFIPPDIFSIDEFLVSLFEKKYTDFKRADINDLVVLLYEIIKKNKFYFRDEFSELDLFYPYALNIISSFEELYIEEIKEEKLFEVSGIIADNLKVKGFGKKEIEFVFKLYEKFYKGILEQKIYTRSIVYRKMSIEIELDENKKYIFAGFFAFTKSEINLVKKMGQNNNFFLVFKYSKLIEDKIKQLDNNFDFTKYKEIYYDKNKINIYSLSDNHGQIMAVGTLLKDKTPLNEKDVIVMPDSSILFALIENGINFIGGDYNISSGYPIKRTPIYGFFEDLFEVVLSIDGETIYAPYYIKFLLHPYVKNITLLNSAENNRIIIHGIEKEILNFQRFILLEDVEDKISYNIFKLNTGFFKSQLVIKNQIKKIHDNLIRPFFNIKNISDFIKKLKDVAIFIDDNSTAKSHPLFYPYLEVFIDRFNDVLSSKIADYSFNKKESYFGFFRNIVSDLEKEFEGTPLKGLQILGFLETRNIRFKRVFFLSLNEGIFPRVKDDMILTYDVRKYLNLPLQSDREKLMYYYFEDLIKNCDEAHLFYIKSHDNERSRFIEKIIWEIEKKENRLLNKKPVSFAYNVNLSNYIPSNIDKNKKIMSVLNTINLSPSAIDTYLECGRKFYYSYVLRLKEQEDINDLEAKDIGTIIHKSLNIYFTQKQKNENPNIEKIINNLFDDNFGNIPGRIYLIRHQVIKKIKSFITSFEDTLKGYGIIGTEKKFNIDFLGHNFNGTIDLIIQKNNKIYIVDFKKSANKKNYVIDFDNIEKGNRKSYYDYIGSFQIPLYMLLYSKSQKIELEKISGFYVLLGINSNEPKEIFSSPFQNSRKEMKESDLVLKDFIDHNEKIKIINEIVKDLIDEIFDMKTPFYATYDVNESCKYCPYKVICGTNWIENEN